MNLLSSSERTNTTSDREARYVKQAFEIGDAVDVVVRRIGKSISCCVRFAINGRLSHRLAQVLRAIWGFLVSFLSKSR